MCSWCWGFSRTLKQFIAGLSPHIEVVRLLGGLARDTDEPMSDDMRQYVVGAWRRIEAEIPGAEFNFDFWESCQPRRSTYPSCRAVIAARRQGQEFDEWMTQAIQRAYYLQARNTSDADTLIELAGELGLDVDRFVSDLHDEQTEDELQREIAEARRLEVDSFPALLLQRDNEVDDIPIIYVDSEPMLRLIERLL